MVAGAISRMNPFQALVFTLVAAAFLVAVIVMVGVSTSNWTFMILGSLGVIVLLGAFAWYFYRQIGEE